MGRLVIDGGDVYELDEACLKEKSRKKEARSISSASQGSTTRKKDYSRTSSGKRQ